MTREEERNTIANKIAWETSKHYDPLLSKESWCEMAAKDAIDWADQHPREGLWNAEKVINWLKWNMPAIELLNDSINEFIDDLTKTMEE